MKKLLTILSILLLAATVAHADTLTLPSSLTIIEEEAFYADTSLDTVILPEGITEIKAGAFAGSSLSSINLPTTLTSIADDALPSPGSIEVTAVEGTWAYEWAIEKGYITRQTSSLDDFVIENGVVIEYVGAGGVVVIPDTDEDGNAVTAIGEMAFKDNADITSVTIPESVTTIGRNAFRQCRNLARVSIPGSISTFGDCAFTSCKGLTNVTIASGVTSIGNNAFEDCSALAEVEIPSSVNTIGDYAFKNTGLISMTIPNGVNIIGGGVFSSCKSLSSVGLPSSLIAIGSEAFFSCSMLTHIDIPEGVTTIEYGMFHYCTALKEVSLPDSITTIGGDAFAGCNSLRNVTIPASVTEVGEKAFFNCDSLTEINVESQSTCFASLAGVLCNKDKTILLQCPGGIAGSYTIPDSITEIGEGAFYHCTHITGVSIPGSVTSIGKNAFYNCAGLIEIVVPDSVLSIGETALKGCTALTSATLPNGITEIPFGLFSECSTLTRVTIPDHVTSIGWEAFRNCTGLTVLTLPRSVIEIGYWSFSGCTNLTDIIIPSSVTSIGDTPFSNCPILTATVVAGSYADEWCRENNIPVNVIGDGSQDNLDDFVIENGVVTGYVGTGGDVVIPSKDKDGNAVTTIGYGAFSDKKNITGVHVPSTITEIHSNAFDGCTGITKLVLPGSVDVYEGAFRDLDSLREVTLPVEWFTGTIFPGCEHVETIHYIKGSTGEMPDWGTPGDYYNYTSRLEYYSRRSLKSIDFEEGITHIGNYAYYDLDDELERSGYALTTAVVPSSVTYIGVDAFKYCPNLTVVVELGSYAHRYCVDNNIPYTTYSNSAFTLRASTFWDYDKALNPVPLHVTALAKGGIKPYQFRYTLLKDGETVRTTAWANSWYGYSDYYFYPENPREGQYSVVVEVEDHIGLTIVSDPCEADDFDEGSYDQAKLRRTFLALVEEAPTSTDFDSVFFNDNMENVSWLPTALNILETDMSLLRSQGAKQKYLFDQAFKASANGSVINTIDEFSVPKAVKALGLSINVEEESYYNGLFSMFDRYNIAYSSSDKNTYISLFKDYHAGIIDDNDLTNRFGGVFTENDMTAIKDSFHAVSLIKTVNGFMKSVDVGSTVVNGTFDIYNQLQLLSAMDRDCVRKIIKIYNAMDDAAYTLAASRLNAILNATSLEDQIALIVYGELGDVGIDLILKEVKLASKVNAIGIAKSVVNFVTGANSYADAMNKLMWACEITKAAERDFNSACARYKLSDTEEYFMDLVNCYSNYMEMAASAEEAYVGVVKWQQSTPLSAVESFFFGTNDYLEDSKNHCQEKATALRCLSESVRQVKNLYKNAGYAQAAAWLKNCRVDQTKLKDIGVYHYDDSSGGGGGGGGF